MEMLGIDPRVIANKLSICKEVQTTSQKTIYLGKK